MTTRILAAPSLDETGGGIALVSAMAWRVFELEWPGRVELRTLLAHGDQPPSLGDKMRFAARMTAARARGRSAHVFYTHLGLAQVERYIPAGQTAYAVFLHGIESWKTLPASTARVLRGAAARVANSAYTAKRTHAANPSIGDIDVCSLGLPDLPPALTATRAPADESLDVLIVGRMAAQERYKGHDELIAIWRDVVAAVPTARLVIAGDGDDRARLETLARERGLGDRVVFTGFVSRDALHALYQRAALFAMPSRGEGFGLVYLEAMAHGLACVGSTHDAAGEIVIDGETGVLVGDAPAALARAIIDLLRDPDMRRRFGAAGRRQVEARFTFDHFRGRLAAAVTRAFETRARVPAPAELRG